MKEKKDSSLSVSKGTKPQGSINPGLESKTVLKKLRSADEYTDGILSGNRTLLSQAITLVESTKPAHRELASVIIENCLPHGEKSLRIGITGVPGVGKSTFIEAAGHVVLESGRTLAVLAVDPSSSRSKGSILGDKTRMHTLAGHENVFIRPSPSTGSLGGVARRTRETMLLCEAAGFNTIFIETVGVGQSETAVHSMVDFFLLLMLAGAGDELQGIKRGIMEMADLIAINKAEADNLKAANRAKLEYQNALSLFPPSKSGWNPKVVTCSAIEKTGISEIWESIEAYVDFTKSNGWFENRRMEQSIHWMHETIRLGLQENFYSNPDIKSRLPELEKKVKSGEITSFKAAQLLLNQK